MSDILSDWAKDLLVAQGTKDAHTHFMGHFAGSAPPPEAVVAEAKRYIETVLAEMETETDEEALLVLKGRLNGAGTYFIVAHQTPVFPSHPLDYLTLHGAPYVVYWNQSNPMPDVRLVALPAKSRVPKPVATRVLRRDMAMAAKAKR